MAKGNNKISLPDIFDAYSRQYLLKYSFAIPGTFCRMFIMFTHTCRSVLQKWPGAKTRRVRSGGQLGNNWPGSNEDVNMGLVRVTKEMATPTLALLFWCLVYFFVRWMLVKILSDYSLWSKYSYISKLLMIDPVQDVIIPFKYFSYYYIFCTLYDTVHWTAIKECALQSK